MLRDNSPIALPVNYLVDYDDVAGIDFDQSPADVAVFGIPFRCAIIEAGMIVTETCAGGTTTPVVTFDKRPTAGSDTDRGSADVGSLTLSTTAAGKVMYDLVAIGDILEPGEEVVAELLTAATGSSKAGHGRPYLLVEYLPEVNGNLDNKVETA